MDQFLHQYNVRHQDREDFVRMGHNQLPQHQDSLITLQENPQFGLTFGRQQTQMINHLFDTPPVKIHTKNAPSKRHPNNNTIQASVRLRNRAQSALHNKIPSKQLDLEKLRQNMSRITYSIKTIESKNDQEIGVTSRRVIMGNKLLETQKHSLNIKFTSNRSRCSSSNHCFQFADENPTQQSQCKTQRSQKDKHAIPHNKFLSKRLNVIVGKKKSSFTKSHQNSLNSLNHFDFDPNTEENQEKQQKFETISYESSKIKADGINKITFRQNKQNRLGTVENKKLKYETLMAKKLQKSKEPNEFKLSENPLNRLSFGLNILLPQCGQQMSARKKKVSLSKILSQYHTQIIQNSNNVLIQRNNFSQPLKQLFKNKFSTISKIVHDEGKNMLEKNLIKIKVRKHSLSKKEFKNNVQKGQEQNQMINMRKFKKYEQIQKENSYFHD